MARLAQALSQPGLSGRRFEVQGHTDATGTDSYNLNLSQRRADSVVQELVRVHGMTPGLLMPVGYGETRLLDPGQPAASVNRRVEVHLR